MISHRRFAQKLNEEQPWLSTEEFENIRKKAPNLFLPLQYLMYVAIFLAVAGFINFFYSHKDLMGVYGNIALIAGAAFTSMYFILKKREPYTNEKWKSTASWFDYILIIHVLLVKGLLFYYGYEFHIDMTIQHWFWLLSGLYSLFLAFRFDHAGVMTLAIASITTFLGLKHSSIPLFNYYSEDKLVFSSIIWGGILFISSLLIIRKNYKKHFGTYLKTYALSISGCAAIAGTIMETSSLFISWITLIIWLGYAFKSKNIMINMLSFAFSYIALSIALCRHIDKGESIIYFATILSILGVLVLKFRYNYLKENDKEILS